MKADTYAKLVVLETLIDAEVGHYLEHRTASLELWREGLVSRISDLVDQIDALDAVAAARIYDAIVDFLAELPEDEEGIVDAALHFRRAVDRIVARGMDQRELRDPSTWAIVLEEVLQELADEYHAAVRPGGEVWPREYLRALTLLGRVREAADRMLLAAGVTGASEVRSEVERLTFAVRNRRLSPTTVDLLIRDAQRSAARYRPSSLTRLGAFVLGQVLRRGASRSRGEGAAAPSQRGQTDGSAEARTAGGA